MLSAEAINFNIESFKKMYLEQIKLQAETEGGISPIVTVLAYAYRDKKYYAFQVPIPDYLMTTQGKEILYDEIIPGLFKLVTERFNRILCFTWCSETWIREARDTEIIPENYENLPKREGLVVSFETEDYCETRSLYLDRIGQVVNKEGNLVNSIKLTDHFQNDSRGENHSIGRIPELFRKFKNVNAN
jgi:hypothetical protein